MDTLKKLGAVVTVGELTVIVNGKEQHHRDRPAVFAGGFVFVHDYMRVTAYPASAVTHADHITEYRP